MLAYLEQLPLTLHVSRRLIPQQLHVVCLVFPSTRIIRFDNLMRMTTEAWQFICTTLKNPTFDFGMVTQDTTLDRLDKAGREVFNLGYFKQALEAFDRGLVISPTDDILMHNRGATLMELGRFTDAQDHFERSLKMRPGDPRTLSRHALCLAKVRRLQQLAREIISDHRCTAGQESGGSGRVQPGSREDARFSDAAAASGGADEIGHAGESAGRLRSVHSGACDF